MADFPNSIFSRRNVADRDGVVYNADKTKVFYAKDHNDFGKEIVAVETILGLNPEGNFTAVADRLDDIDAELAGESWNEVSAFLNDWVNYNVSTHNKASYFKDSFGVVHLKGLVKSGTIGESVFTLPVGYRPGKVSLFAVNSNNAFGACVVESGGAVKANAGSNAYFSFDGVTFRVA